VEVNLRQFNCLQKILLDYNTSCIEGENSGSQDVDELSKELQHSFHDDTTPKAPVKAVAPSIRGAPVKCASCGVVMKDNEEPYTCTHDECEDYNVFHLTCVHLDTMQNWVCDEHYEKPETSEDEDVNVVDTEEEE
jgi:hypothetical protein